ncbi:unnamed protein product [Cylicocyclus nassatus]|uniref:Uncharacterized protein n=1 Tax=Cylicocyclus nassatus TaxID=53992 RepID=A0AA36DQ48_CYLNA|nr:unnamed protein product [Cylicocyclus nassatus]
MLTTLLLSFLSSTTSKEYGPTEVWITAATDRRCTNAEVGDDLRVTDICVIQIEESTRMNTARRCDHACDRQYFNGTNVYHGWPVNWKWEGRIVTVALLVARVGPKRANENPVAYFGTKSEKNCRYSPPTGTGSDFSEMYSKNPFRIGHIDVKLWLPNGTSMLPMTVMRPIPGSLTKDGMFWM